MGKKLTKKKALEIAEGRYKYQIETYDCMYGLCGLLESTKLDYTWNDYWKDINTERISFIPMYFVFSDYVSCEEEDELLRLLTLHIFIEDIYG